MVLLYIYVCIQRLIFFCRRVRKLCTKCKDYLCNSKFIETEINLKKNPVLLNNTCLSLFKQA